MIEPPRGMYPARLDEKGRLKLPVSFQHFFIAMRDKSLYVTSLDRRTASVYPLAVWRETEKAMASRPDLARHARNVAFTASDLGSLAEMDGQGRIQFSPELRRELGIENAPVRIHFNRGRFDVLSDAVYEERKRKAAEGVEADMEALEAAGLI
jgi:DNA-binding transcriptional regulator/RsmH inhibitor MraZ